MPAWTKRAPRGCQIHAKEVPEEPGNSPPGDVNLGQLADRSLHGEPRVPMMETSDHGCLDDPAQVGTLHRSSLWRILLQGKVSRATLVVGEVVSQQVTQMGFVQHHDVVEILAAEGADEPFDIRILPRRPSRRLDFVDPHGLRAPQERDPVHRIAIAQEVSRSTLPGEGLHELLDRPLGGGGVGDVEVASIVCKLVIVAGLVPERRNSPLRRAIAWLASVVGQVRLVEGRRDQPSGGRPPRGGGGSSGGAGASGEF
jgi:hypothetical protein